MRPRIAHACSPPSRPTRPLAMALAVAVLAAVGACTGAVGPIKLASLPDAGSSAAGGGSQGRAGTSGGGAGTTGGGLPTGGTTGAGTGGNGNTGTAGTTGSTAGASGRAGAPGSGGVVGTGVGGGSGGASVGVGGTTGAGGGAIVPLAFPVRYSANARYLQDANAAPFPILGRTAWFIISRSVADYQTFLSDTVTRGYNAVEMHVIDHDPRGNTPPFAGNGSLPFLRRLDGAAWTGAVPATTTAMPDFTTPNETYWAYVDAFLTYCESRGVLVFFFPAYVGYAGGDQGWMQELLANGASRLQTYGTFIANRYKNQRNLVWMMGGDMGTGVNAFTAAETAVESGLLTGLKSVAQQSIYFSAEWDTESIGTDQSSFGTSMTLNGAYSWSGDVSTQGRRAYAHAPAEPSFLLEEPYDEEGGDGNSVNGSATQPVRRFQWWGWLSTIGGYISGNGYVWPFNGTVWQTHLNTQGSRDMGTLNAFIKSIPWYQLVPSGLGGVKTLITAGGGATGDAGYVAAAATPTGTWLVAYVPPAHTGTITVDLTALSGTSRARWFNPTTAAYTAIANYPNTATQIFTPPGNNGSGSADWVLVVDKQ